VTITPIADDPNASVTVNGVAVEPGASSGPIAVAPGTTQIPIAVTSPDRSSTTHYAVNVLRPSAITATFRSISEVPVTFSAYDATGLTVDVGLGYAPPPGTNLMIVKNTGPSFITGRFSNLVQGQIVTLTFNNAVYRFVANYYGGSGNDLVLQWAQNRVFAWGNNLSGGVGAETSRGDVKSPVPVTSSGVLAGKTIMALAKGAAFSLALCADGTLAGWGSNYFRQFVNDQTTNHWAPVEIPRVGALSGKRVVAIAAGSTFCLALCEDGTLAGWGSGAGEPVEIGNSGALVGKTVTAIACGHSHSLALCADGTVVAWGTNTYGELGNGSQTSSNVPVKVDGTGVLAGKIVVAIAANHSSSLALCVDGTLAAWGANSGGQLGNNTTTASAIPVAVSRTGVLLAKTVSTIAAGSGHYLALCTDGTLVAWGSNYAGGLGNNSTMPSPIPVLVSRNGVLSGKAIAAIDAGSSHSLAVCTDGVAAAWGSNNKGQLGNNSTVNRSTPVTVSTSALASGEKFVALAPGPMADHSLALVASPFNNSRLAGLAFGESGPLPCFAPGTAEWAASVPHSTTSVTVVPTAVDPDATVRVNGIAVISGTASAAIPIAVGANLITMQVTSPDRTSTNDYVLTVVRGESIAATFTAASDIPVSFPAFDATGLTVDCALGFAPAIGTNLTVIRNTGPGLIGGRFSNLAQGQEIRMTYQNTSYRFVANYHGGTGNDLVLQWADNKLYAWGYNHLGQLGINSLTSSSVPVAVTTTEVLRGKTILAVATGRAHCLALCADGTLAAWGDNSSGQLGDGTTTSSLAPVAVHLSGVLAGRTVVAVSAGSSHSLALCADGTVAAWGSNGSGQLGNDSTTNSNVPVAVDTTGVLAGRRVVGITAGGSHSMAVCENGTVIGWGGNANGCLGIGYLSDTNVPMRVNTDGVLGSKMVLAVAAGWSHTFALGADGTMAAWGYDYYGQLGDNVTGISSSLPVSVNQTGVLAGKSFAAVAPGYLHSIALCTDGTLVAWGANSYGELGNNSSGYSSVAVLVDRTGVLAEKSVVAITADEYSNLGLCSDGTLVAWGRNEQGQLGNGSTTDSSVPAMVDLSGLPTSDRMVAVAIRSQHVLAIAASPPRPVVATLPATDLASLRATLNGTVIARDELTTVAFEYGPTSEYGTTIPATPSEISGTNLMAVAANLSGLNAETYHYRIVATDRNGTSYGDDVSFTPLTVEPPPDGSASASQLLHLTPLADGQMNLTLRAKPSRSYLIQRSTDRANWTALTTVTTDATGAAIFLDESPPKPAAYYRVEEP
jgi:alpha-tubulin suppressor-like RCC1 family protein